MMDFNFGPLIFAILLAGIFAGVGLVVGVHWLFGVL